MSKPTLDDIFLRGVKIRHPKWREGAYITWCISPGLCYWGTGEAWGTAHAMIEMHPTHDWEVYTPPAPKPQDCPFCGGVAVIEADTQEACIVCSNGDCLFYGPDRPTENQAIEAWNRIQLKGTES